jgi:ATP-dependent DNA helicase RecG
MFSGKVGQFQGHQQLAHPDYTLFDDVDAARLNAEAQQHTPIPIYPATSTVATWQVQKAVATVLAALAPIPDPLPTRCARTRAARCDDGSPAHPHSESFDQIDDARRTLRMHEAFILQTALLQQRETVRAMAATARRRASCSTSSMPACRSRAPPTRTRSARRSPLIWRAPGR